MAEAPVRRRSARGQGEQLRGELLRAARELLAETGVVDAVSLRAVAQRTGVSVPSIYLHFADKKALIDAVCGEVFEALHQRARAAGQGHPDPFRALRAQGNAYVHFALENPEHYRIVMMTEHEPGPEAIDAVVATSAFGLLLETVRACLGAGIFEGEELELALGLWAAVHGVAALLVAKPYFPWPDRAAFIDRTVCMAGLGLASAARFDADSDEPLDGIVERFDRLRD